jgi:hypothetical protein
VTYPNADNGINGQVLITDGNGSASFGSIPSATNLATPRNIYGGSFDGSADINNIIESTYGGTGNGFTKFSGPTGSEKTFTLPDDNATILTSNTTVTVAQGGTGLTTAGNDGQVLTSSGGSLTWTTPATISIGTIAGTSDPNGASITSGVLNLAPADGTNGGVVTTGTQTFAGAKTFSNDAIVNGITVGRGGGSDESNTVIGKNALVNNTTGIGNTANGWSALSNNTDGKANTAIGAATLNLNTTGEYNTASGGGSLNANTEGKGNTANGYLALNNNTIGNNNTAIGTLADVASNNLTNATAIGYGAQVSASNTIQLGADGGTTDIDGNTIPAVTAVNTSGAITAGGKIIAGASSAASSSAVLEANSTTQGFLPPRLTTTQRDAITNGVEGLTIWNTSNKQLEVYDGEYWRNMVGLLVSPIRVGDEYGGGIVFYIFNTSDIGYIKGQTHGLIAAPEDQTTDAGIKWFPEKYYGATGTYIGLGLPNTLSIILSAVLTGTTNLKSFAAGLANSYRGGGYMDWYLPSKDELNLLYQNKDAVGGFATSGIPGYWSSTQKGTLSFTKFEDFAKGVTAARIQFFYTGGTPVQSAGTITDTGIENLRRVRAIRVF